MRTNLIRSIISNPWMITAEAANDLMPMVVRLINGEEVDFSKVSSEEWRPRKLGADGRLYPVGVSVPDAIGYIPLMSVVTKYTNCDLMGTYEMTEIIKTMNLDPNVKGIIFEIDTPGGQAGYMDQLHKALMNCNKPTIAFYHGTCASAGYYVASGCDEIYALSDTDRVGSIGTMISFYDYQKWMDKEGVKLVEVYASESSAKNRFWREVQQGKYQSLIEKMLDPFNKKFLEAVQAKRSFDISGEGKDALKGEVYTTAEAIKIGMITGMMDFEGVVERMRVLIENKANSNNNLNPNNMNKPLTAVANLLGMESIEQHDGIVSLSVENMEAIEAALVAKAAGSAATEATTETPEVEEEETVTDPTLEERISALEEENTTLKASVNEKDQEITALNSQVTELSKGPGAEEATPIAKGDDFSDDPDYLGSDNNPLNERAKELGLG
jgi:ClpP class serine protease